VLLTGAWPLKPDRAAQEEARRIFYVGMTRARKTLAVFDRMSIRPSLPATLNGPGVIRREFAGQPAATPTSLLNYAVLGLEDIHLGYAGRFPAGHQVHAALSRLEPGNGLEARRLPAGGIGLLTPQGLCVARLSAKADEEWRGRLEAIREARVLALVQRRAGQDPDEARRERYRVAQWEVPLVEVVFEDNAG
jgi:ATP-dependent DNA helicase RecQ